jgi:signal transduction histidine kinase
LKNGFLSSLKRFFSANPQTDPVKKNNFFESVFQFTLNAYFVYSKETLEVIEINKTAAMLLELPADKDLKGINMTQVMMRYLAGDSPNLDLLMNQISERWTGEATFITHNKKRIYGLVNTNILPADMNECEYQVLCISDATALKHAKDDVTNSLSKLDNATKSKARFLSSMSHELRTPLNGIIGTSNVILADPGLPQNIKDHLNVIRYSSEHMLGIVNDLLDFSKMDAKKMELKEETFNLVKCFRNIGSSFSLQFQSQGVDLVTSFSEKELENIEVVSDQTKLSQVLKNLLSNALKFTPSGKVEFKVKIKESSDTRIELYFEIRDSGIGIAKDKQQEIFNAFSQIHSEDLKRKYEGTGLGLTISRQLVNMMGGTLKVESELHKGSSFYFTVSFKRAPKAVALPVNDEPSGVIKKDIRAVRVLVVEDNEINASILKSFLLKWQLQIKEAITGIHALELIKYHKFDLILMDLEMPEMNGYTALKKIRETNKTVPVIAFTATLLDDMDSLITEAGFTDYVVKPFKPAALKKKIEMYCERKVDYV